MRHSLILGFCLIFAGCGGGGGADVTFTEVQEQVFNISCTASSCHDAQAPAANLSLVPGAAYDNLIDVDPDTPEALARGYKLVVAGDAAQSFILVKLAGTTDDPDFDPTMGKPLGDPMPQGQPDGLLGLDPERYNLVRDWIRGGALNN